MKGRAIPLLLAVCCAPLAVPALAGAAKSYETKITLKYAVIQGEPTLVAWFGEVKSKAAKCENQRKVKFYEERRGKDRSFGSPPPESIEGQDPGEWGGMLTQEPDRGDEFYAKLPKKRFGGKKCEADTSKTVTYRG